MTQPLNARETHAAVLHAMTPRSKVPTTIHEVARMIRDRFVAALPESGVVCCALCGTELTAESARVPEDCQGLGPVPCYDPGFGRDGFFCHEAARDVYFGGNRGTCQGWKGRDW